VLSGLCLCTPGVPKYVVKDCVYLLVHETLVGKAEFCTQYKECEHTHTHTHTHTPYVRSLAHRTTTEFKHRFLNLK